LQFGILNRSFQFFFNGPALVIDLFQIFEIPHGGRQKQSEQQIPTPIDRQFLTLHIPDKIGQHIRCVVTDRHEIIGFHDDSQRNGDIGYIVSLIPVGNAQNHQGPAIFRFDTGTFVDIPDIG